ncbi:hypothetical protein GSI_11967 [Ganoderma sinense ZZ0214-1]|uniref:Uncharacterized protein n=1 Tax=Ganoderma sinense ZZ0214-1 TaxID=1077348 RepID=A0A2G8RXI0_9APHY|nr:hypothetical protein GSI_11967 [Ganoderma sinense ZZ0214-1]
MPWMTTFVCQNVKFRTDERPGSPCADCAEWSSVNISVHELGVETPWLLVEKSEDKDRSVRPIIFRAMRVGWRISCDEQTMTITMQGDEIEALTAGHQKLRFEKAADFWSLMYQISTSRLREYTAQSAGGRTQAESRQIWSTKRIELYTVPMNVGR